MSLNVFAFNGRLGADAEVAYTQGGTAIWTARVAVDYGWGDKKGTTWLNAKALGKHAESLGKLELRKGARIGAYGELQVREYDKRDGGKGTSVDVLVSQIDLLDKRQESGDQQRSPAQRREPAPAKAPSFDDVPLDDDIPFE